MFPLSVFADKYDDVNSTLRDILLALSQVSVQGKDASTFAQIQQGLVSVSKDIVTLQKEKKTLQDDLDSRKEKEKK